MPLGRHLLLDLTGIPAERLNDVSGLEQLCVRASRNAGAAVVSSSFHPFAPHGVSGVVVIHESHVAIHTWPEHGFAALDVFTCGDTIDPSAIAGAIHSALGATGSRPRDLDRGESFTSTIPPSSASFTGAADRSIWFTDREEDIALSLRATAARFRSRSDHQKVEILETSGYGRMLVLDDRIACTERDEFIYHEMLVHVPALAGPPPRTALVLGGGDGGAARELLRYDSMESITVVEIDEMVVRAAREHLPALSSSLDDHRVGLVLADGAGYLAKADRAAFDLILVDSGAPEGPADPLFTASFYESVRRALAEDGRFVTQLPPPTLSAAAFADTCAVLAETLGAVHPYLAYIPTYNTGMLAFALAGAVSPIQGTSSLTNPGVLKYFNEEIARSAFALPAFVRALL